MDPIAADLCQELFTATRRSPGQGGACLARAELLLGQLSGRGYDATVLAHAQSALNLQGLWTRIKQWAVRVPRPEHLRAKLFARLNALLEACSEASACSQDRNYSRQSRPQKHGKQRAGRDGSRLTVVCAPGCHLGPWQQIPPRS